MKWWMLFAMLLAFLTKVASSLTTFLPDEQTALEQPEFHQSHAGMSSLTFVLDGTGSMYDDLDQVRHGFDTVFDAVTKQRERFIYNYVLVMFHDPEVDEPLITTDGKELKERLRYLNLSGGSDCPELTLTGIIKAINASLPGSFIYVFTDARSKDYYLIDTVLNLIQEKQSSIVFVMTGDCLNQSHIGYRVFQQIAAASFGQIFHLQKSEVFEMLKFVQHSISQRKVHLLHQIQESGTLQENEIAIDSHMAEFAVFISTTPTIDDNSLDLIVLDPQHTKHVMESFGNDSKINLATIKFVKIIDPIPGIWKIKIASRNRHTLRVVGHSDIDFKCGFSNENPNESIKITQPLSFGSQRVYLWVNMTGLNSPGLVERIAMVDYSGKEIFGSKAVVAGPDPTLFVSGLFTPPTINELFFVRVEGIDDNDYKFERISHCASIVCKSLTAPTTIKPPTLNRQIEVGLGEHLIIPCQIDGTPLPKVEWFLNGHVIVQTRDYKILPNNSSQIPKIGKHHAGNFKCKAVNAIRDSSFDTKVSVQIPPKISLSLVRFIGRNILFRP